MRVPLHIVEARRESLRTLIRTEGFLPVSEICRRLDISPATARRDLAAIEGEGHISRTRGGALADYNSNFASHDQRLTRARTAKSRIADAVVRQLPSRGAIFLDAGTTVQAIARSLVASQRARQLIVVTNSLPVATVLGGAEGVELHVIGGTFFHRQAILLGPESLTALSGWVFDAAAMGGEGMDAYGITNSHAQIAAFQAAVLAQARQSYFVLDASKLDRATPHRVTSWEGSFKLATDARASALTKAGIRLPADRRLTVR